MPESGCKRIRCYALRAIAPSMTEPPEYRHVHMTDLLLIILRSMTAIARKLHTTPMAPYLNLLQGISREDKKL